METGSDLCLLRLSYKLTEKLFKKCPFHNDVIEKIKI